MVQFFVDRIKRGKTTLDKVPESLREAVIKELNKEKNNQ